MHFFAFVMLRERRFGNSVSCTDRILYKYTKGILLTHRQVGCIPILGLFYSEKMRKPRLWLCSNLKMCLSFAQHSSSYPTRIDHTFCFFKTIICSTTCSRWKKMCPRSVAEPLCSRETMTRAYFLVMCSQCRCRTPSCYTFFSIMLTINEYLGQHNMMYSIENGHVIFCLNCAHRCCSSI